MIYSYLILVDLCDYLQDDEPGYNTAAVSFTTTTSRLRLLLLRRSQRQLY